MKSRFALLGLPLVAAMSLAMVVPSHAKNACKGLDEAACGAAGAECRWVEASTKDGKERPARCAKGNPCKGLDEAACSANAQCEMTSRKNKKGEDVKVCKKAKS